MQSTGGKVKGVSFHRDLPSAGRSRRVNAALTRRHRYRRMRSALRVVPHGPSPTFCTLVTCSRQAKDTQDECDGCWAFNTKFWKYVRAIKDNLFEKKVTRDRAVICVIQIGRASCRERV